MSAIGGGGGVSRMNVGGAIGAFVAGAAALHAYTVVRDWAAHCEAAPATPAVPPPAADLVVVTGASRGLGQAVAVALAAAHPEATGRGATGRVMVLTARTASGLDTTAKMVEKAGGGTWEVLKVEADLSDAATLDAALDALIGRLPRDASNVLLVNNAGSLGGVTKAVSALDDLAALRVYFELNLVSVVGLTARFLQRYSGRRCTVVNISSLLAVVPFSGYGLYATGKAARDMLFAVIAKEHPESEVKTLNYAPGPLDTDMQTEIRDTHMDDEQREFYAKMKTEGTLLSSEQSATKLATLLASGDYESGAHVDFYDLP